MALEAAAAATVAVALKNPPAKCIFDAAAPAAAAVADLLSKSVCARALHMSSNKKKVILCARERVSMRG